MPQTTDPSKIIAGLNKRLNQRKEQVKTLRTVLKQQTKQLDRLAKAHDDTSNRYQVLQQQVRAHTVFIGSGHSHCLNCGADYHGGTSCRDCHTSLCFAGISSTRDTVNHLSESRLCRPLSYLGYIDDPSGQAADFRILGY